MGAADWILGLRVLVVWALVEDLKLRAPKPLSHKPLSSRSAHKARYHAIDLSNEHIDKKLSLTKPFKELKSRHPSRAPRPWT